MNAVHGIIDRKKARGMAGKLYPIGIQTFSRIREETIQELKDHYDGYHFCWPSPDVFNPYSLFLATVPYCDNTHYEGHWQQTLYIMFALLTNYEILVEPHTAKGRIDLTLEWKIKE